MPSPLGVYFLDVGQGDCSFILPPDLERAVLFDCNDAYVAERFVIDHGIKSLAAAVVSHLDIDHIRGMLPFLRAFMARGGRVGALHIGLDGTPDERLHTHCTELVDQALRWEADGALVVCQPTRDIEPRQICSGEGWSVDIVLPHYSRQLRELVSHRAEANRCSAVLRVARGDVHVLIGGDAPLSSFERLEAHLGVAKIIRAPHHGGEIRDNGKDYSDLYDRVKAGLSVFSVGSNNQHGHPHEGHVEAAHRGGDCRILCTQLTPRCHERPVERLEDGLAQTGEVTYAYRHLVPRSKGTAPEVPCAGSIAVTLDGNGGWAVAPAPYGWHHDFVVSLDAPMCE